MPQGDTQELKFLTDYYAHLVGFTVEKAETKTTTDAGYPEVWTKLFLKRGNERISVEISRDQEGNGPGFLFLGPVDEDGNPIEQEATPTD